MNKNNSFSVFVVLVVAALIVPEILRDGIFMDGNLYASVSVNYARGEGHFWSPHFSKTSMSFFHEQPPLMFGLLGTIYKLFGEHMLVERFYSLSIFVLSAIIFLLIWNELFPSNHFLHNLKWMSLLVWIIIPNSFWVVIHNLEENTMGLFVLLTIFLQLKSWNAPFYKAVLFMFLSSLSLVCAFLTKGFPSLFPIIFFPLLFSVLKNSSSHSTKISAVLYLIFLFSFALCMTIIFMHPVSAPLMHSWLFERVINSIQNVSTTENRFGLLVFLLMQLVPVGILFGMIGLLSSRKKASLISLQKDDFRKAIIFLILALAGSIPLIVTREQRGFYLATSFPYYAIAFTVFIAPYCSSIIQNFELKPWSQRLRVFNYFFAVAIFVVTFFLLSLPKRDPEKFHDYRILTSRLNYGQFLSIGEGMWNDWELQTAMVRNKYISITPDTSLSNILILDKEAGLKTDTMNYVRLPLGLRWYTAYAKKTNLP